MRSIFFYAIVLFLFTLSCSTKIPSVSRIDNLNSLDTIFYDGKWLLENTESPEKYNSFLIYPSVGYLSNIQWPEIIQRKQIKEINNALKYIYDSRGYRPIWLSSTNKNKNLYTIWLTHIAQAENHGIDTEIYQFDYINKQISFYEKGVLSLEESINLELDLSRNYILMSLHLMYGVSRPIIDKDSWLINDQREKRILKLADFQSIRDLERFYKYLLPKSFQYELMLGNLALYKSKLSKAPLKTINLSNKNVLKPGDQDPSIILIKQRLAFHEELIANKEYMEAEQYDIKLMKVVKNFQRHFGLVVDANIGPETLKALNRSPEALIDKIALNMERMRWWPQNLTNRYIQVNVPSFSLQYVEREKTVLDMKVVVGKYKTKTPIFSDTLEYLVFSPTWIIPKSIKVEEMLPKLIRDSSYYSGRTFKFYRNWAMNNEVDPMKINWKDYSKAYFPFKIVQQPGESNALGLVKFIMPNDLSIYLHDTPAEQKFNFKERTFSHGCIRLEKPAELAYALLDERKKWNFEKIYEAMHLDEPKKVFLPDACPVFITYFTAYINEDGILNFRNDVYNFDTMQKERLISKNKF